MGADDEVVIIKIEESAHRGQILSLDDVPALTEAGITFMLDAEFVIHVQAAHFASVLNKIEGNGLEIVLLLLKLSPFASR